MLRRLRNRNDVVLPEAQQDKDIQTDVPYEIWAVSHFPMELPWVRDRTDPAPWRSNMLEDVRENGLRWPLVLLGHSPKPPIGQHRITDFNRDRSTDIYVQNGTNRYYCLWKLGYKTFPAVLSLNKGVIPKEEWGEHWKVDPNDFPKYCSDTCHRIWVRRHAFGYSPLTIPKIEFA